MQIAVEIAQRGAAHRESLHRRRLAVHLDQVAHAELVLEDDEDPRDHVTDQGLCAEAERDAGDPGGGEQGPHVPAQHAEHVECDRGHHHRGHQIPQDLPDGLRALARVRAVAADPLDPLLAPADDQEQRPLGEQAEDDRQPDPHPHVQQGLGLG